MKRHKRVCSLCGDRLTFTSARGFVGAMYRHRIARHPTHRGTISYRLGGAGMKPRTKVIKVWVPVSERGAIFTGGGGTQGSIATTKWAADLAGCMGDQIVKAELRITLPGKKA